MAEAFPPSPTDWMLSLVKAANERRPIMVAGVQYVPGYTVPDDVEVHPAALRAALALLKSAYAGNGHDVVPILQPLSHRDLQGVYAMLQTVSELVGLTLSVDTRS